MAGTATYPTGAIRDALERAANDPELPASARQRELRTIRDELKHLAGYADSLLGELSLAEQREALDDDTDFRLAEDAAIREEMLRRGLATEEQLDELGLHPAAEVAERRADGTLAESVSAADFLPYLHPRGRAGQFIDSPHFEASPHPAHPAPHPSPDSGLPESMPPPRPNDPLLGLLTPVAADAMRSVEPDAIASAPTEIRTMAELDAAQQAINSPGAVEDLEAEGRARWERWKETDDVDPSTWTPPPGVTYSPEVAAIASPADAEKVLKARGVQANLTPPDTEQGRNLAADTDFFKQIAQATVDALDRHPVLSEGPAPLRKVALWSDTPQREGSNPVLASQMSYIWGATGQAAADPLMNPSMHALAIKNDAELPEWPGGVDIIISDVDQDGTQSRTLPEEGGNSWATASPYGRMTHELGHAAYSASGLERRDLEAHEDPWGALTDTLNAHLWPHQAERISGYATSSQAEAWAEAYATLNVPGAMDELRSRAPDVADALEGLREDANSLTKWELL